jgi:hypothetical protein
MDRNSPGAAARSRLSATRPALACSMADIFISYGTADRAQVAKLAAYLETEGWSVWWDRSLTAGDDYRDEIMKHLALARAVIVVWSKTSAASSWVRSEAGRAQTAGKYIPVKVADLTYADIPPPFDVFHTEDISALSQIRGAVVAQLTKPASHAPHWWLATRDVRYVGLQWFGIGGAAITLFAGLRSLVTMTAWANWFATHWQQWNTAFWHYILSFFHLGIGHDAASILTFYVFIAAIAASARKESVEATARGENTSGLWRSGVGSMIGAVALNVALVFGIFMVVFFLSGGAYFRETLARVAAAFDTDKGTIESLMVFAIIIVATAVLLILHPKLRKNGIVANGIYLICFSAILIIKVAVPLARPETDIENGVVAGLLVLLVGVMPLALLLTAHIRAVNRRLVFLLIGLAALIGLNEASRLSLDQYVMPPAKSSRLEKATHRASGPSLLPRIEVSRA